MSFFAELPLEELRELVARNPDEIDLRLALVEQLVRQGRLPDALTQTSLAEALAPRSPDVAMWKSLCQVFTGRAKVGHERLQRVIRNHPCSDFQTRLVHEVVPLFTGQSSEPSAAGWVCGIAASMLDWLPPEYVASTQSLIEAVNLIQQNTRLGILALEGHVECFPQDLNARLYLAIAYCGVHRIDDAIDEYRQVIQQDRECATAYLDLAAILEHPQESIRLTRMGLRFCPQAYHARYNLGVYLMQRRRFAEARQELSRIPADHPIYTDALVAIGMTWEEQADAEQATEILEKAVTLSPRRADIHGKLGQLLCDCGQHQRAMTALNTAIELDPAQYYVWANKGLLHLQASEFEEALQALQRSLELNPQSEDAAVNLALLLAETGNLEQGIEILEEAIHYHPENALICQNLGAFYCHNQEIEQALFYTDRAIELGIDSPSIYWNMANIYCFQGNRERCLEFLVRAIDRDERYAEQFLNDEDFRRFQQDPEFVALCRSVR